MVDNLFNNYIADNLGIYNNHHMYNENLMLDINKHIEQGVQYKQYGKRHHVENQHSLLQASSSPEWGSIVEAMSVPASINQMQNIVALNQQSPDEVTFNNMVSNYATMYKTYTSTMLTKAPEDNQRIAMEQNLAQQQEVIITVAQQIKEKKKHTSDTVAGQIETTDLNMTSMYYHYFVYFVLSVTLLAFTFNILVNPAADIMSAVYVVGALLAVYFVMRKYEM